METFYNEYYVLQYPEKESTFVALDYASGGYPYETSIFNAHKFTYAKAKEYIAVSNKEGFTIQHVVSSFTLRAANS